MFGQAENPTPTERAGPGTQQHGAGHAKCTSLPLITVTTCYPF